MNDPKDALDALLLVVMQMVAEAWPEDLGYHVGMAMGQVLHARLDREEQEHQQPGEWRSYNVDGYSFSIRQNDMGILEVQKEETSDES